MADFIENLPLNVYRLCFYQGTIKSKVYSSGAVNTRVKLSQCVQETSGSLDGEEIESVTNEVVFINFLSCLLVSVLRISVSHMVFKCNFCWAFSNETTVSCTLC